MLEKLVVFGDVLFDLPICCVHCVFRKPPIGVDLGLIMPELEK